jgi:glycerol-3-phosphate dehydrogenase
MAVTSSDVTALKEAIASGVLSVTQGGKTITYRSMAEMRAALDKAQLEVDGSAYRKKRVTLARSTRRSQ